MRKTRDFQALKTSVHMSRAGLSTEVNQTSSAPVHRGGHGDEGALHVAPLSAGGCHVQQEAGLGTQGICGGVKGQVESGIKPERGTVSLRLSYEG